MAEKEILLKIKNLSKSFGENTVLKDINFDIAPGEIVGLVGENGAGKSTLMKIIFGMSVIEETGGYQGEIFLEDQVVKFTSPFDALEHGIGMVHQEFSLIPGFDVAENIVLNRESLKTSVLENLFGKRVNHLDKDKINQRAKNTIENLGIALEIDTDIKEMPVAHKQFTEIAREMDRIKTKLLILDEPTAVLTEKEAEVLLDIMRKIAAKGISIIFITHRLDEILSICDKVVVLRDGILINNVKISETNVNQITGWMIGREISQDISEEIIDNSLSKEDIMILEDFSVDMPGEMVKRLNLKIKKGEILGIGGMAGQGKLGIANGIMGIYDSLGKVTYKGKQLQLNKSEIPLKEGIFFVSEDRKGVGLLLESSIKDNIAYPSIAIKNKFMKKILKFIEIKDEKSISDNAKKYIESLEIKCMDENQPVSELSGGNQQKVCLAKAFTMDPELLFVSEPTRGIDVGAKKLVLDTLKEYNKERGTTIVVTSSEIEELRSICDRIAIVNEGCVVGILSPKADILEYGKLMVGVKEAINNG